MIEGLKIINKWMMVGDTKAANERFVICKMNEDWYAFNEGRDSILSWKMAEPILLPKPSFQRIKDIDLTVWEFSWGSKETWFNKANLKERTKGIRKMFLGYLKDIDGVEIREIENPTNRFVLKDCMIKAAETKAVKEVKTRPMDADEELDYVAQLMENYTSSLWFMDPEDGEISNRYSSLLNQQYSINGPAGPWEKFEVVID